MALELPSEHGIPTESDIPHSKRFAPLLAVAAAESIDLTLVEPRPLQVVMGNLLVGHLTEGGGFVEDQGRLAAVNAVAVKRTAKGLELLPLPKAVVDDQGRVHADSVLVYERLDADVRFTGLTFNIREKPWFQEIYDVSQFAIDSDGWAVARFAPHELGSFEPVEAQDGSVEVQPRPRYL